ncbi:MAG: hypothetical protein KF699_14430 [Phycisphaeraceae bacterium]|nr:hypothetical protein [Phycisphaeraceae bacterium]
MPMNDRQIHELLRMAAEIERIEVDAASVVGHIGGRSAPIARGRRLFAARSAWVWGSGIAAAAAVALGIGGFLALSGGGGSGGGGGGVLTDAHPNPMDYQVPPPPPPSDTAVVAAPALLPKISASPALLLAIYQDMFGGARCVQIVPRPLEPGESLAQIARDEMLHAEDIERGAWCAPGPHRLLVVALAGPADRLPTTYERAEALASCIALSRDMCSEDHASYANAAYTCLPPGVSVRVESTIVLR